MKKEVRLPLEMPWKGFSEGLLKEVPCRAWHPIPLLGTAPVMVVDGIEHVILDVPAEAGEHHANVHPRHDHPRNVLLYVTQH